MTRPCPNVAFIAATVVIVLCSIHLVSSQPDNFNIVAVIERSTSVRDASIIRRTLKSYQNQFRIFEIYVNQKDPGTLAYDKLCKVITKSTVGLIAIANKNIVNSVSLVAKFFHLPTVVFSTRGYMQFAQVYGFPIVSLSASRYTHGEAIMHFLHHNHRLEVNLIVDHKLFKDGIIEGVQDKQNKSKIFAHIDKVIVLPDPEESPKDFEARMMELVESKIRVYLLHARPNVGIKALEYSQSHQLLVPGSAWFVTDEMSADKSKKFVNKLPLGLISLEQKEMDMSIADVLEDSLLTFRHALNDPSHPYRSWNSQNNSQIDGCTVERPDVNQSQERFYRSLLRSRAVGSSGKITFDKYGSRRETNLTVWNLISRRSVKQWQRIGLVVVDRTLRYFLDTIIWPGNMVVSPGEVPTKKWTVVTTIIHPFVIDMETFIDQKCLGHTTCLRLQTKDPQKISKIFDDYNNGTKNKDRPYSIRCCKGYSIDLLNKLSSDLNFKYQMYIVADNKSGALVNQSWNGLVHDLKVGAADMAIAAFSITPIRSKTIDFTMPYFYSGFSMLTAERDREIPLYAFLEPLDTAVWISVMVVAVVTAVSMSVMEWNSPFGLNPWGRKRKSNYTLCSAFNAIFAILFGHTIRTKTPKSWPCKYIQNIWAGGAIFIYASYTANLAAFIAGKKSHLVFRGIEDSRLLKYRVGIKGSTALEGYVGILHQALAERVLARHTVSTNEDGFDMLKATTLDIYLGDTPVLEYARSEKDPKCILKIAGRSFGEDGYGIGLPKGSWMKVMLSQKIHEYRETGYLETLRKNYFYLSKGCINKPSLTIDEMRMSWQNHRGLYVFLLVTLIVCIFILLPCEHIAYRWFVPYIRRKPRSSRWKNINMMFLSQRFYRIVNSKELISSSQAFREMAQIIRSKRFSQIFQKERKRMFEEALKAAQNRRGFTGGHQPEAPKGNETLCMLAAASQGNVGNGRLPQDMFLSPFELLPWNKYGSQGDLKTLVEIGKKSSIVPPSDQDETPEDEINPLASSRDDSNRLKVGIDSDGGVSPTKSSLQIPNAYDLSAGSSRSSSVNEDLHSKAFQSDLDMLHGMTREQLLERCLQLKDDLKTLMEEKAQLATQLFVHNIGAQQNAEQNRRQDGSFRQIIN